MTMQISCLSYHSIVQLCSFLCVPLSQRLALDRRVAFAHLPLLSFLAGLSPCPFVLVLFSASLLRLLVGPDVFQALDAVARCGGTLTFPPAFSSCE